MPGMLSPCCTLVGDMSAPVPTNSTFFKFPACISCSSPASLLKRALKEIHALGGDYVAVLTGPEKDQEHGSSYSERIAVHHKAVVVEYAPKAGAMAEELERAANEMALQGWELVSSTVTPAAKGILLFRKRGTA